MRNNNLETEVNNMEVKGVDNMNKTIVNNKEVKVMNGGSSRRIRSKTHYKSIKR